jgi:TM2 domain-containing membrane protein YozV
MMQSTKAALLSFFVFPGAGHIYLKKYLSAGILASTTVISLYFIIDETIASVRQASEKILNDGTELGYAAISEQVARQNDVSSWQAVDIASIVLLIVWVGAIIDSYRIGRSQNKES